MTDDLSPPTPTSALLAARARSVMPGGNSRSTIFARPYPRYMAQGSGAWLTDVDGNRFLDCNNNYTSLIHGHSHPDVVSAIAQQAATLCAAAFPTALEIELAELIVRRSPAIEQVRFMNSGTEAVMHAIKAARAFTGRRRIAKVEGAYHGGLDLAEVSLDAAPGNWGDDRPLPVAYAKGTPTDTLDQVVVLPFNDCAGSIACLETAGGDLAAILVDPVPLRVGLIPARRDYLQALRRFADTSGALLIFDEVISLRIDFGGAHSWLGVQPDLITMGKFIGGGLPVGALGGSTACMSVFDETGGKAAAPHGGTFNANPLTMAAGIAAMRRFDEADVARLNHYSAEVFAEIAGLLPRFGGMQLATAGSLFRLHMTDRPLTDYRSSFPDASAFAALDALHAQLFQAGVAVGKGLVGCLSTAMRARESEVLIAAFAKALDAAQPYLDARS